MFAETLLQGTAENNASVKAWIDSLNAAGETCMDLALTAAFDMLDCSKLDWLTRNCQGAILFLTYGENTGEDPLTIIRRRNHPDARFFTYALGS